MGVISEGRWEGAGKLAPGSDIEPAREAGGEGNYELGAMHGRIQHRTACHPTCPTRVAQLQRVVSDTQHIASRMKPARMRSELK